MSDTMRCVQIEEWGGEPIVTTADIPEVGPTDVLIEVETASVGLTASNVINGDLGSNPDHLPRIPGHEAVGRVAERGAGVTQFEEGDPVASYTYLACDHCPYCWRGRQPLCENLTGFLSVEMDGGYAEFLRIPAANAIGLPPSLDPLDATVVPDAVATSYHVSNQRANVGAGDHVMILGAGGGIGIHLVQMAQYFGGEVTAVDLNEDKLARCQDLGAKHAINTSDESIADHAEAHGARYDAIVDFTGSMPLVEEAAQLLAPRGRLVNMTTFPGDSFSLSPRDQVFGETEVVGSRSFAKHEMHRAGELVDEGIIEPVISDVVEMDDVGDLLSRIRAGDVIGRGAITVRT